MVLPGEGNVFSLRIVRDLQRDLGLSEAELKKIKLKNTDNGGVTWDETKDRGKEVAIGDRARKIIKDAFSELNKQKKLKLDHLTVWEKFLAKSEMDELAAKEA